MNKKKLIGIVLCFGAIIVLAVGGFFLLFGHMKSGIGLLVVGVLAIIVGLVSFFSRLTAQEARLDKEWQ